MIFRKTRTWSSKSLLKIKSWWTLFKIWIRKLMMRKKRQLSWKNNFHNLRKTTSCSLMGRRKQWPSNLSWRPKLESQKKIKKPLSKRVLGYKKSFRRSKAKMMNLCSSILSWNKILKFLRPKSERKLSRWERKKKKSLWRETHLWMTQNKFKTRLPHCKKKWTHQRAWCKILKVR